MSTEIHDWKFYLPEARIFCDQHRERNANPSSALIKFGIRPFGDETWREAHRLIAKAISQRVNDRSHLLVIQDQGTYGNTNPESYGSSSLSQ